MGKYTQQEQQRKKRRGNAAPFLDEDDIDPEVSDKSEDVQGEEDYEIEMIIADDYRAAERKRYYKVRWKGWAPEDDSWVAEDCMNAPDIIKEYKKKKKAMLKASCEDEDNDFIVSDNERVIKEEESSDGEMEGTSTGIRRRKGRETSKKTRKQKEVTKTSTPVSESSKRLRKPHGESSDKVAQRKKTLEELKRQRQIKKEREETISPAITAEVKREEPSASKSIPTMGEDKEERREKKKRKKEKKIIRINEDDESEEEQQPPKAPSPVQQQQQQSSAEKPVPDKESQQHSPLEIEKSVMDLAHLLEEEEEEQRRRQEDNMEMGQGQQQQHREEGEMMSDGDDELHLELQSPMDDASSVAEQPIGDVLPHADAMEQLHLGEKDADEQSLQLSLMEQDEVVKDSMDEEEKSEEGEAEDKEEEEAEAARPSPKLYAKQPPVSPHWLLQQQQHTSKDDDKRKKTRKDEENRVWQQEKREERQLRRKPKPATKSTATMDEHPKKRQRRDTAESETASDGGRRASEDEEEEEEEEEERAVSSGSTVRVKEVPKKKQQRGRMKDGEQSEKASQLVPEDVWYAYTGTAWQDPEQMELESEDDSDYEPMMPLDPDAPANILVSVLEDDEQNGLDRDQEVESVLGVGVAPPEGQKRQCFVKFVGLKNVQQISTDQVQEEALQAWIKYLEWQCTKDNLDKCGAYWKERLQQPTSWMCHRSLNAFAAWKKSKGKEWQWAPRDPNSSDTGEEDDSSGPEELPANVDYMARDEEEISSASTTPIG